MDGSSWWPTRLLFLVLVLNSFSLVQAFPIARNDTQLGQKTEDSPISSAQNEVSWQSAFWALVAIAIGAATQPSGRILGMPSEWGFALKLSPILCIVNAVEALSCIEIRWRPWAVEVRPGKYYVDEAEPAASSPQARRARYDPSTLQHNSALSVTLFILGPVLQAVKLFSCSGIKYTQAVAAAYLASFICDEVVLTLLWANEGSTRRSADRMAVKGLVTNILELFAASEGSEAINAGARYNPPPVYLIPRKQPVIYEQPAELLVAIALMVDTFFLAAFGANLVYAMHVAEPNLLAWDMKILVIASPLMGVIGVARPKVLFYIMAKWFPCTEMSSYLEFKLLSARSRTCRDILIRVTVRTARFLLGTMMFLLLCFWFVTGPIECGMNSIVRNPRGRLEPFHIDIVGGVSVKTVAGVVGIVIVVYPAILIMVAEVQFSLLWDDDSYVSPEIKNSSSARPAPSRVWWNFPVVWCTFRFLVGLLTYYTFFGARETFQPGWTGVLG